MVEERRRDGHSSCVEPPDDDTAKPLRAHLEQHGIGYQHLGGVIDGIAYLGDAVALIDWKTPGKDLTNAQTRLVAAGCRVYFLSNPEQVEHLARQMKAMATR